MGRLTSLDLPGLPGRAALMALAAAGALAIDFASKQIAVAAEPSTLLFHVSDRDTFGLGTSMILLAAAGSLLACVLPVRVVALGAGAALGGALGNLASRHWWSDLGGSPDFIRFADGSTGNVADLCIAAGATTMLLGSIAWLAWTVVAARRAG